MVYALLIESQQMEGSGKETAIQQMRLHQKL